MICYNIHSVWTCDGKKTSPFNDKIILKKATVHQLTSVYQALGLLHYMSFTTCFLNLNSKPWGHHNPAVLLLIFLVTSLNGTEHRWTVWDYSTWYEKASGRTLQKQLCWNESLAYTPNHLPILSHFPVLALLSYIITNIYFVILLNDFILRYNNFKIYHISVRVSLKL